ncbi:MAG: radical SAM protein [Clostridia bacterium]|nr:radical SAM protein [Clostridia bacterium]
MEEIIAKAWQVRQANFPKEIEFAFPAKTRAVSVTGTQCGLKCAHCSGRYLEKMIPIAQWRTKLSEDTTSCLISGGCDLAGKVPVLEHLPELKEIRQSGRKTNLHVGLLEDHEIEQLSQVADVVSFDFVGDDETIKEVYGLDKRVQDYTRIFNKLKEKVTVLPHICLGLRGGQISGEYKALELLRKMGVDGLVFIVFAPTAGTPYAEKDPPQMEEVAQILCKAREDFPTVPIHLGCMRPKGKYRAQLDQLALRCGVNKIVQPTPGAVALAQELGLVIKRGEECCVL